MLEGIWNLLKGILIGVFAITVIAVVIILGIRAAMADETIAVRPAYLGEQDRSLNYPLDPSLAIQGDDIDMLLADPPTWDELVADEWYRECLENNKKTAYRREYVLKAMARNPSVAYIYEDTLEMLVPSDCEAMFVDDQTEETSSDD